MRRVGIGKSDSSPRERFKLGSVQLTIVRISRPILISARVAHAHIVGEKNNTVRRSRGKDAGTERKPHDDHNDEPHGA